MITKEIKERLEEWDYTLDSENPLKITTEGEEVMVGLTAEATIHEIKECIEYEKREEKMENLDFSDLDNLEPHSMLLVKADVNYADEFDMSEFTTMTVEDFKEIAENLKNHDEEIEWYFGTNEELWFENGASLLSSLEFRPISKEEASVIYDLFDGSFGQAGVFENIYELGCDEEGEDDGDEFFCKQDKMAISKLESLGWTVEIYKEEDYLVKITHENGKDYAISHSGFIHELLEFINKKKK